MRRGLPSRIIVWVTIGVGVVVLAHQLIANPLLDTVGGTLVAWAAIVAAFAVLLGLLNVVGVHFQRIMRRDGNSWSSAVILVTALLVLLLVLPSGGTSAESAWLFQYLYQPLEASFLALLVFFIATAAYRALRARTWETALLVVAALIVLIGSAPIASLISPQLPALKDWVMNVPTVAGVRGILLGVALGIIATGLRLLTGIDRPYSE
jgi:hypothetical protein